MPAQLATIEDRVGAHFRAGGVESTEHHANSHAAEDAIPQVLAAVWSSVQTRRLIWPSQRLYTTISTAKVSTTT